MRGNWIGNNLITTGIANAWSLIRRMNLLCCINDQTSLSEKKVRGEVAVKMNSSPIPVLVMCWHSNEALILSGSKDE